MIALEPRMCILSPGGASLELLKLIPDLRVLRIEFQGFLEVLDRALLVALCVFHLRYRLIGACRLREILQIGLPDRRSHRRASSPSWRAARSLPGRPR